MTRRWILGVALLGASLPGCGQASLVARARHRQASCRPTAGVLHVVRGRDMLRNNDQPRDGNGHGTHAAGIVGATANNGRGIVGVAPRCRILAEKVVSEHGYGDVASVAAGIVHAADQGAQIIT